MSEEIEDFLDAKPGVLEGEDEDGKFITFFDKAYYFTSNGRFGFIISQGGVGKEYDVLYEEIEKSDDGTLSFEYMGFKRVIRRFRDEDGTFFMQYEMPFPAEYMEQMMEKSATEGLSMQQSIEAFADPESGEVKGFIYDIDGVGTFFRVDSSWKIPDQEMAASLDGMESVPLSFESAKQAVKKWDGGSSINVSDLDPNKESEE
jgi:hypothetical protein